MPLSFANPLKRIMIGFQNFKSERSRGRVRAWRPQMSLRIGSQGHGAGLHAMERTAAGCGTLKIKRAKVK